MLCVSLEIYRCLFLPLTLLSSLSASPLSVYYRQLGPSCLSAAVASQIAVISFNLSQRQRRWLRRRQQQMLPLAAQIVFVARLNTHTHKHTQPQPQPVQNAHKKSAACPCSSAVNTMRHIPHGNTPLPPHTHTPPLTEHAHASRPSTTSAACCAPMHNCCLYEKISPNGVLHYLPPDAAVAVAATATANCCQVAETAVSLTRARGVKGALGALSNCES